MGSVCETIEETIDYLNAQGRKVGLVKVRLYRPFCAQHLIDAMPDTVKTDLPFWIVPRSPALWASRCTWMSSAALKGSKFHDVPVFGGRYGLGSKDTTPGQIIAVYDNLTEQPKDHFTIGIVDDVTNLSLQIGENPVTSSGRHHQLQVLGSGF